LQGTQFAILENRPADFLTSLDIVLVWHPPTPNQRLWRGLPNLAVRLSCFINRPLPTAHRPPPTAHRPSL
jgi:hypothetical protein